MRGLVSIVVIDVKFLLFCGVKGAGVGAALFCSFFYMVVLVVIRAVGGLVERFG